MKKILMAFTIVFALSSCAEKPPVVKVSDSATFEQQLMAQVKGIKEAIDRHFTNSPSFSGKNCILRAKFAPDGLLLSINSDGGDPELCRAALSAASIAKFPPFINDKVYRALQNAPLNFKPR